MVLQKPLCWAVKSGWHREPGLLSMVPGVLVGSVATHLLPPFLSPQVLILMFGSQ